jgi:hypothetical protein
MKTLAQHARELKAYKAAAKAYDFQSPPEDELEVEECDDHDCGICIWCLDREAEAARESDAADRYDQMKYRRQYGDDY